MVQFREYEWQPAPPGTTTRYYDISIPQSPLTIRNRTFSRNAVPSGLVASRVLFLQKTGQSKSDFYSGQSPSVSAKHRRSSSRAGFGRRLTNRFGQPAVINDKPDEEAVAVDTSHTFAGLKIPRKNHTEHHAFADSHLRISRSSTQIQLLAQAQDGAGGAGKVLWKSKSYNPVRYARNSLDLDVSREVDTSGNHTNFITQTTIFPLPPNADMPDMFRQEIQSRTINTVASENSTTTTSTIRRQSVRDLFEDYGIDRPAGLVSKHTSRESENTLTLNTEPQGKCHLCAWINSDPYTSCWRCGHKICSKCEDRAGRPVSSRLQKFPSSLEILKPNISPREIRTVEEPVKQIRLEPTPLALNVSLANAVPARAPPSILPRFPALYEPEVSSKLSRNAPLPGRPPPERSLREQPSRLRLLAGSQTTPGPSESYEPQKLSRRTHLPEIPHREKLSIPLPDRTLREQSSRVSLLTGSQTTTKVKESPFLIADAQTPRQSLRPVPIESYITRSNTRNSHRIPHRQSTECQNGCIFPDLPSPDGATRDDGKDPAKEGNSLHRAPSRIPHEARIVTSRSAGKQGQHVYDGTDTGYIADTSVVDEGLDLGRLEVSTNSKSQTRTQSNTDSSQSTNTTIVEETHQPYTQAQSRFQERAEGYSAKPASSPVPRKHSGSSQLWNHLSTMQNSEVPEFVECHGYPRTGHTRHAVSPIDAGVVGECQHCLDDCPCAACQNTDHSVRCCTHADHQAIPHVHNTLSKLKEAPTQGPVDLTPSISTESTPQPDSLPLSPRTSIAAASILGQTQNSQLPVGKLTLAKRRPLPRSQASKCRKQGTQPRKGQDSVVSQTVAFPRASIVDASLNVGKSRPVLPLISTDVSAQNSAAASPTESSRPTFKEHNIFCQPSRRQDADSAAATAVPNTSWISELVDPNMREKPGNFTFPSRKKTKVTGVYSREYVVPEGSRLVSTVTSSQPKKSEAKNRMGQKLPDNRETPKEPTTLSGARVETNGEQEVGKLKQALAAVIPPRRSSLASNGSEKKLKLKLIDRKDTPVDGQVGSEVILRLLVKDNRALSSFSSDDTLPAGSRPGSTSGEVDHACVWKSRYEDGLARGQASERESKDINISGITVVLHLEGREDLVIKAESWKGGRLSVDADRAGGE